MEAKQHLYYALGILAYAVAKSDGEIQREEKEKFKEIVCKESEVSIDYSYTDIIFKILKKENQSIDSVYKWAMDSFELGKHHFTDEMKAHFVDIIKEVAQSFPPITNEEQEIISKFEEDLTKITTPIVIK